MPGPLAIPIVLAGIAGLGKITAAAGLLTAAGGSAYYLNKQNAPEMLIKLLLTTADLDTTPVKNFGKGILDSAHDLGRRRPLLEILKKALEEVASSGIAILLMDWVSGLFSNEESDEAVNINTNDCSSAVEEINRQCGENIDAGGARLLQIVESLLAELATIDKVEHPEAYQQCLDIIADVIAEYCAVAGEEILDRDETMGQCLDLLVNQVEEEASRDLGVSLPDAIQCAPVQCAPLAQEVSSPPKVSGSSEVAASAVSTAPVSVSSPPSVPSPEAQPAGPSSSSVTAATSSVGAASGNFGVHLGAQLGAAAASFVEQFNASVTASASSSVNASEMVTTPAAATSALETCAHITQQQPCGPAMQATATGVGNIVGMIAAEVDKAVQHAATGAQSAIEQFKAQASSTISEFCGTAAESSCDQPTTQAPVETVPVSDSEANSDCPPDQESVAPEPEVETVPAATEAPAEFDKSNYKELAQAEAAEGSAVPEEVVTETKPVEEPAHQVDKSAFVGSNAASTTASSMQASMNAPEASDQREAGSW